MEYTREKLIEICEKALINHNLWSDRDSAAAIIGVGSCLALLKTGCRFEISTAENTKKGDRCVTDDDTIWITFWVMDFLWFENLCLEPGYENGRKSTDYHYYLPTEKRLKEKEGKDWY